MIKLMGEMKQNVNGKDSKASVDCTFEISGDAAQVLREWCGASLAMFGEIGKRVHRGVGDVVKQAIHMLAIYCAANGAQGITAKMQALDAAVALDVGKPKQKRGKSRRA